MGWSVPVIPKLLKGELPFTVTADDTSYIVMSAPAAYIIGCPIAAFTVDRIGRKLTMLLVAVPQIVMWIVIANANSVVTLCIAKAIGGIGEGLIFVCLPIYTGEVCEPKVRGMIGSSNAALVIIGSLLINVYGSYLTIEASAYVSLIVPVLFVVTFIWMPESPYYYLMKGKQENAKASLQWLRRMNNVKEELESLTVYIQQQLSEPSSIKDVFMISSNRKSCIILCVLRIFHQFSGIIALTSYSQYLFQQSGSDLSPIACTSIYLTVYLFVTVLGCLTIDKLGRRPLLIFSLIGSTFALFAEGVYFYLKNLDYNVSSFNWFPLFGMLIYVTFYSPGIGICPLVLSGEMLSATVKAKALGILNIIFAISMAASLKTFQGLNSKFGMHVPFFVFGASCFVGTLFSYYFVPETKGKTLEEIQKELKGTGTHKRQKVITCTV